MENKLENKVKEDGKKYNVLLVEDKFWKSEDGRDHGIYDEVESYFGGSIKEEDYPLKLKEALGSKINYNAGLDITRNIGDAISKIETERYDLVITDVGLPSELPENKKDKNIEGFMYGNYKRWEEVLPEHYKIHVKNRLPMEQKLKELWIKYRVLENGIVLGNTPESQIIFNLIEIYSLGNSLESLNLRKPDSGYMGNYIANISKKKFPTLIHTARGHFSDTACEILAQGNASHEELTLLKKSQNNSPFTRQGIVYTSNKKTLDDFAYVINDAIETELINKK